MKIENAIIWWLFQNRKIFQVSELKLMLEQLSSSLINSEDE